MDKRPSVLVIDDDKNILKSANMYLKKYTLFTAQSGSEALAILNKNTIDIIVSDYNMPEINGLELTKVLNDKKLDIPVIIMSGQIDTKVTIKFANLHVAHIFEKPFLFDDLILKIDEIYTSVLEDNENKKMTLIGKNSSNIIHDINNSLGVIVGSAALGIENSNDDMVRRQFERSVKAADQIKNTVVLYKKFINNKENLILKETSLKSLISNTFEGFSSSLENFQIILDLPKSNDYVSLVEPLLLSQVLLNLASNSVDANKETQSPWIKVSLKSVNEKIIIKLSDSGKKITNDVKENLFKEKFTTKKENGTGMGLFYSKDMIEKMFGKISFCENEEFNCFKIELMNYKK